jgi:hypothetical protein
MSVLRIVGVTRHFTVAVVTVTAIAVGQDHSCALTSVGGVNTPASCR